jgi:hypothetical protein
MSITDLVTGNNQEVKWLGLKNLDEAGRFCRSTQKALPKLGGMFERGFQVLFGRKISYETCARRSMAPTSTVVRSRLLSQVRSRDLPPCVNACHE